MRVIIAIGTTGGHIYPGMAVSEKISRDGNEVILLTRSGGIAENILKNYNYKILYIMGEGLKRKFSPSAVKFILKLAGGFIQSFIIVLKHKPDVILGMGGHITFPVVLAGRIMGKPCIVHEQNVLPGLAVKMLSGIADAVAVSFEKTKGYLRTRNTVLTGNPIRESIKNVSRKAAEAVLGLKGAGKTVLVFGGSQGALTINNAFTEALKFMEHLKDKIRIIHITGPQHYMSIKEKYDGTKYNALVLPFLKQMECAYACADLIISRAGATTVSEISAVAIPSILVPYPFATKDHQTENAKVLAEAGGAIIVKDSELNGEMLADTVGSMIKDEKKLNEMKAGMSGFKEINGTELLVKLIYEKVEGVML